jgi:hypothetical protein
MFLVKRYNSKHLKHSNNFMCHMILHDETLNFCTAFVGHHKQVAFLM